MGNVVQLERGRFAETLTDFIQREGQVATEAVAYRFGWDIRRAYAELSALRKAGVITSKTEAWGCLGGGGRMNAWRISDKQQKSN